MVNFSANNLYLLDKQVQHTFVRFTMRDRHTKRTYRLYDFKKHHHFDSDTPYVVTGKVNSAHNRLFLVLETARVDRKNMPATNI